MMQVARSSRTMLEAAEVSWTTSARASLCQAASQCIMPSCARVWQDPGLLGAQAGARRGPAAGRGRVRAVPAGAGPPDAPPRGRGRLVVGAGAPLRR